MGSMAPQAQTMIRGKNVSGPKTRTVPDRGDSSFVRSVRRMIDETPITFATAVSGAEAPVEKLDSRREEAIKFLATAHRRKEEGKLTGATLNSEEIKANTVIRLCEMLDEMHQMAIGLEDPHAVERIGIAAKILDSEIDSNHLLRADHYPPGELGDAMAKKKLDRAQKVYETMVNVLDTAPERIGVEIPAFSTA
jgi:hypothetical protein